MVQTLVLFFVRNVWFHLKGTGVTPVDPFCKLFLISVLEVAILHGSINLFVCFQILGCWDVFVV